MSRILGDSIEGDKVTCYLCKGKGFVIRKRKTWPHGTINRYARLECRCVYCTAAFTLYWRARRDSGVTRITFEPDGRLTPRVRVVNNGKALDNRDVKVPRKRSKPAARQQADKTAAKRRTGIK